MKQTADAPVAPAIVAQASHWLMLHWGGELSAQQQAEFYAWQAAHPEHQRAWGRLQRLQGTLAGVPPHTARAVLREVPDHRRRDTLKLLSLLLAAGGSGYLLTSSQFGREQLADVRTGTGDIRHLQLADGSRLDLNSGSAVDIQFSASERRIRLLSGELQLTSAHEAGAHRPLIVETAAGEIEALGTRFSVRELDGGSRTDLYEGALQIRPRHAAAVPLQAGQSVWFSASQVGATQPAQSNAVAWSNGRLIAERQPLGEFLADLSRHRRGLLRCEPAAAKLLLTGVFPLADTERVLATLAQTLPIQIDYRTRYWVTVRLTA